MTAPADGPGALAPATPEPDAFNLLVGVCGSANVINIAAYLFALRRIAPNVRITAVMTRSAAAMLPPQTLGMICEQVYCDGRDEADPGHVRLGAWSDLVLVLPATANMLGQAAFGLASGLLSSTLLAVAQPVVFFPSMNKVMWERPAVRRNVALLRADGHVVIDPVPAAGWVVADRQLQANAGLPQPADAAALIRKHLADRFSARPGGS